ncbi:hypothetical protein [Micromonospora sp. NPDC050276]|uniref:hypothetical protein n=1 Tax=Micromonospora sp. NPDC050276 TaxID=3364278 RepID=UPI0037AB1B81
MSVYISAASLILSAIALAWSRYQWKGSVGRPKTTLHYGVLTTGDRFFRVPWPHGQRAKDDRSFGLPVLMVTVMNTGRGALFIEHVEIDGTICGICGPYKLEFPLTVEPNRRIKIYYLPVSMGFTFPEQMDGKRIRATVYYDVDKTTRSNPLILGQRRKHAARAISVDLGPSLPPSVAKF